ncbi:MAG: hypothetical protein HUK15_02865, partial [Bacteroidales bacterium]|nr:hypothetical protein [Bacteroidales bacterium]
MKKILLLLLLASSAVILYIGCHKDPIVMQGSPLKIELVKAYASNRAKSTFGDTEFVANITVTYQNGDTTEIVAVFKDPNGDGVFTNDMGFGIKLGVGFHISISAVVDGMQVYGTDGRAPEDYLYYGEIDNIQIQLLAGSFRIGINDVVQQIGDTAYVTGYVHEFPDDYVEGMYRYGVIFAEESELSDLSDLRIDGGIEFKWYDVALEGNVLLCRLPLVDLRAGTSYATRVWALNEAEGNQGVDVLYQYSRVITFTTVSDSTQTSIAMTQAASTGSSTADLTAVFETMARGDNMTDYRVGFVLASGVADNELEQALDVMAPTERTMIVDATFGENYSFSAQVNNLLASTNYYVRAFAVSR